MAKKKQTKKEILKKASRIKMLLTDVDGVLTDTGVYYSVNGEQLKRFSIRDGMGIERLRKLASVETGIITQEDTQIVGSRAKRLKIKELHMGVMDKTIALEEITIRNNISPEEIAYMGDDTNDIEIMKRVGLSACPNDATKFAKDAADLIVESNGGNGAIRDLCELIIEARTAIPGKKKKGKK